MLGFIFAGEELISVGENASDERPLALTGGQVCLVYVRVGCLNFADCNALKENAHFPLENILDDPFDLVREYEHARGGEEYQGHQEPSVRNVRKRKENVDVPDTVDLRGRTSTKNERLKCVLRQLDDEYKKKNAMSKEQLKPPSLLLQRRCIAEFRKLTLEAIPEQVCAVCAQILPKALIVQRLGMNDPAFLPLVPSDCAIPKLDRCGVSGGLANICGACWAGLRKVRAPLFAMGNGFDVGCPLDVPEGLSCLTLTEERLISLYRSFGIIVKLFKEGGTDTNFKHTRGHIIVMPQKLDSLATCLPSPVFKTTSVIKVIWVGRQKPGVEELQSRLEVRKDVVFRALVWLKANNPLYSSVHIDIEYMKSWKDAFVPEDIVRDITLVSPEHEADERSGYAENVGEVREGSNDEESESESGVTTLEEDRMNVDINDDDSPEFVECLEEGLYGSVFTPVDGEPERIGAEVVDGLYHSMFGLPGLGTRKTEPYIRVTNGPALMNSYEDPNFFLATFPSLFCWGKGGHLDERRGIVSFERWAKQLLNHHGRRFGKHGVFQYLVFDVFIRRRSAHGRSLLFKRTNWIETETALGDISEEDLLQASKDMKQGSWPKNQAIHTLLRCLLSIGQHVPLSNSARDSMRTDIKGNETRQRTRIMFTTLTAIALIVKYGAPCIWFTLNPGDIGDPLVCKIAGVSVPMTLPRKTRAHIRKVTATRDPVSSARFFKIVIDVFFKALVRTEDCDNEGGAFGKVDHYFATTEHNGRGRHAAPSRLNVAEREYWSRYD